MSGWSLAPAWQVWVTRCLAGMGVKNVAAHTEESVYEILGAAGVESPEHLRPWHRCGREGPGEVKTYAELFPQLKPGALLRGEAPEWVTKLWNRARPDSFS